MLSDETLTTLRPHVDAMADRIADKVPVGGDREAYAWGAVLSAFARSLEAGDNTIVFEP